MWNSNRPSSSGNCISYSQCTSIEVAPMASQESFTEEPARDGQQRQRYFTGSLHTSPREHITSTPTKPQRSTDTEFENVVLESAIPVCPGRQSLCVSPVPSISSWEQRDIATSLPRNPSQVLLTSIRSNGNTSALSSNSVICRICHEGESQEELVSPCQCRGTVGRIHLTCAEKWLSSANRNQCEICGVEYVTRREPRPFLQWLQSPSQPSDKRNLVGDAMCFLLLTPLAIISAWLCVSGALHYSQSENGHWETIGLIALAILLVLIYFTWCTVAVTYHIRVYRKWQRNNQVVRIVASRRVSRFKRLRTFSNTSRVSDVLNNNTIDLDQSYRPVQNTSNPLNVTPPLAASSPGAQQVDLFPREMESPIGGARCNLVRYSRSEGSTLLLSGDRPSFQTPARIVRETCV